MSAVLSAESSPGRAARVAGFLARVSGGVAALCGVAEIAAGLGYRFGAWTYGSGILTMRWAAGICVGAFVVALIALVVALWAGQRRAMLVAAVALTLAVVVAGPPLLLWRTVSEVPRIHDITTDTADPPAFVAVLPLRKGSNSVGIDLAAIEQQKKGYPDIAPQRLDVPPAQALKRAETAVRALGWEVVAMSPGDGRIEATDTTLLFGFKDDIVIRIRPDGAGSRVDARSVSRVGRSDFGVNAKRIRKLQAALAAG